MTRAKKAGLVRTKGVGSYSTTRMAGNAMVTTEVFNLVGQQRYPLPSNGRSSSLGLTKVRSTDIDFRACSAFINCLSRQNYSNITRLIRSEYWNNRAMIISRSFLNWRNRDRRTCRSCGVSGYWASPGGDICGVKLRRLRWHDDSRTGIVIVHFKGTRGSRLGKVRIQIFRTSDLTDWP